MVDRVAQRVIDAWPTRIFFVGLSKIHPTSPPPLVCDKLLKGPDIIEATTHTLDTSV